MALRFASFLLCTLCAVGFGVAIPAPPPTGQCGQNSEYRTCGSPCAPTCANPFPGPLCVLPCVDACFCAKGYLKSANGTCVRPEQCEQVHDIPMQIPGMQLAVSEQNDEPHKECTSPNEEYRSCGPMCQPTCHTNKLTMFCSLRCNKGCFCKEGYIRDASNNCIPVSQCPQESNPIQVLAAEEEPKQCGDNEEYRNCGPFCQPTCNQRLPKRCSLRCKKGCFCKESYLRNQEGKCVPKSECEAVALPSVAGVALPLHGVTLRPGSGSLHKFTIPPASMPEQTGPISIPLEKVPLQANSSNNMEYLAVPQCPHPDEEFSVCGVQQDCMNACMHHPMKPQCMQRMCTPGCKCREPLVRRQDGVCVEKTQCSH